MSKIADLTRNSVQSGLSPTKWVNLCKLLISKNYPPTAEADIGAEISNAVLVLFSDHPGDPTLQAYLKRAIQAGLLSLSTFVRTFLLAATSPKMHNVATLDMLCKVALEYNYENGIGPTPILYDSPTILFEAIHHGMSLLKIACELPSTHYHELTQSASNVLMILLASVTDFAQLTPNQAVAYFADARELISLPHIPPHLKQVLEQFVLSLSYTLGDDAKAAREAQLMHSTLGKGHSVVPNSDSDIVSCSLLLRSLVVRRISEFGAGDGHRAVVLFIALVRSASWTPTAFYMQLLLSAVTRVAQEAGNGASRSASLWRAFVVGRLPYMIAMFSHAIEVEGTTASDWKQAMNTALASLLPEEDLLAKCDLLYQSTSPDSKTQATPAPSPHPFISELLHQLQAVGVVDRAFAVNLRANHSLAEHHSRILQEAHEHSSELEGYFESKLGSDTSVDDVASLLERVWQDPCSHKAFSDVVQRRFKNHASALDMESLGHLCKILYSHDAALEILSLHVRLADLIAQALVILEDYDCETEGDPQNAVINLGHLVLFLHTTLARYDLSTTSFESGDRRPSPALLNSAAFTYRSEDFSGEEMTAFTAWHKALFDVGSEGIDDSILRSTRPKALLRMAATLVSNAIHMCAEKKMDKEVLNNGISYFLSPLLNWTLAGVVRSLLSEIQHQKYLPTIYHQVEVLQTFITSPTCPGLVLKLSAAAILRALPETNNPQGHQRPLPFDPIPIRQIAFKTLGVPVEEANIPFTLSTASLEVTDYVKHAVREAFASARAKKAPSLDVDRCLLMTTPSKFLAILWAELTVVSTMGQIDVCRRIATHVLSMPRSSRSPPLLPVFLHITLPGLISAADRLMPNDQALAVELLVAVVSSALTAALYVEWALLSVCKEKQLVLGQPALTMARRLSGELRRKNNSSSPTASALLQRLSSNGPFMANFPTFAGDM